VDSIVNTSDLAALLDDFLHVDRFPSDDFAEIVPFSHAAGIRIEDYATEEFLQRFNGLALENADEVACVFTLVFPSSEVLADVQRRASGRSALIFTHHPMDFETSGAGLMPIRDAWLRRLRAQRISLYAAHAPLDCHETVSTSRSLARALKVPAARTFANYMGGHAGVHGRIDPVPFEEFAERLKAACGVEQVTTKRNSDTVEHVAVVAGGAAFPGLMEEALAAGCDTYVTGDFQVRHGGPWAEEHRPQFDAFVEEVPLNLIGGSHYATEALVLQHEMLGWFNSQGLPAEFVPQSDPWR
jgi:putative NIF3 family GTP cyclohydrolase 1 type 2